MTRLAEVKGELEAQTRRADRYQLAIGDVLTDRFIARVDRFRLDGTAFTVRTINRADPLIVITVTNGGSWTEVHGLEDYARYVHALPMSSRFRARMIQVIGDGLAAIAEGKGRR